MNQSSANDLAMGMVEKANMGEPTKDMTYSAVAWFIYQLYKENYEVVPRFMPKITLGDIKQMEQEGVIY